jgi:hypothetical protein
MSTIYRPAPAVERIAKELIPKHHDHLATVDIKYLFVDPPAKSKGDIVWGKASIVSGRAAYLLAVPRLAGTDAEQMGADGNDYSIFVIEISEAIWGHLDDRERRALVDHELSHCWAGENERGEFKLATRGHDVEEFQAVVARHGLWRTEVREFAAVTEQLSLTEAFNAVSGGVS